MDRNIGAPNRRLPPDVQPRGSTSRDLDRREDEPQPPQQPEIPDGSVSDPD